MRALQYRDVCFDDEPRYRFTVLKVRLTSCVTILRESSRVDNSRTRLGFRGTDDPAGVVDEGGRAQGRVRRRRANGEAHAGSAADALKLTWTPAVPILSLTIIAILLY